MWATQVSDKTDLLFVCQHELVACVLKIVHKSLRRAPAA